MKCPVCKQNCDRYDVSFSREGTWCNHAGWVLRTGLARDDPPILEGIPIGSDPPVPQPNEPAMNLLVAERDTILGTLRARFGRTAKR